MRVCVCVCVCLCVFRERERGREKEREREGVQKYDKTENLNFQQLQTTIIENLSLIGIILRWGFLIWELIFIYCGLYMVKNVVR